MESRNTWDLECLHYSVIGHILFCNSASLKMSTTRILANPLEVAFLATAGECVDVKMSVHLKRCWVSTARAVHVGLSETMLHTFFWIFICLMKKKTLLWGILLFRHTMMFTDSPNGSMSSLDVRCPSRWKAVHAALCQPLTKTSAQSWLTLSSHGLEDLYPNRWLMDWWKTISTVLSNGFAKCFQGIQQQTGPGLEFPKCQRGFPWKAHCYSCWPNSVYFFRNLRRCLNFGSLC